MNRETNLKTRPLLINFEGGECAGKETQLYPFIKFLIDNDNNILGDKYTGYSYHREPTDKSEYGIQFNKNLANHIEMSAEEALGLVVKDRLIHQDTINYVINQLEFFYILSRYADSTGAYQVSQGADIIDVYNRHMFDQVGGTRMPDLTIYLQISAEESIRRSKNRIKKDLFDTKVELIKKVDDAYIKWFNYTSKLHNRHIIYVNGEQKSEEVTKEILEKVTDVIKNDYEFFKPLTRK